GAGHALGAARRGTEPRGEMDTDRSADQPGSYRLRRDNRHGEAVGYHHRPNGVDPPGARVQQIVQPPDASGVYRARVALRDSATGGWIDKKAPSTFFPDAMSDHEVVDAVLGAFRDGRRRGDGQFVGGSGRGFAIEGWYQNG